jgi:hypothetical protein
VTNRCRSKVNSYPNLTCRKEFLRPFDISTCRAFGSASRRVAGKKAPSARSSTKRTTSQFLYDPSTLYGVAQTAGSECFDRRKIAPWDREEQIPGIAAWIAATQRSVRLLDRFISTDLCRVGT